MGPESRCHEAQGSARMAISSFFTSFALYTVHPCTTPHYARQANRTTIHAVQLRILGLMLDLELDGKVAIVTGASRGLGRATAVALIEQGVRVLVVARSLDELEKLASDAPDSVSVKQCDMCNAEAVAGLPQLAVEAFSRIDIIVNNAGNRLKSPLIHGRG